MNLAELVDASRVGVGWSRSSKRGAPLLFSAESALDPRRETVDQFRENHQIPSSLAAVSPSMAILSASLKPGVFRMWSTDVLVHGYG